MSLIKKTSKILEKANVIPVFFATDDNYAPLLAVAMYSLVKSIQHLCIEHWA